MAMELGQNSDFVLSNGAQMDFKLRRDVSGALSISELRIYFPTEREIPSGGISAKILREIQIGEVLQKWAATEDEPEDDFFIDDSYEKELLHLLSNYPSQGGRTPTPALQHAAMAFFYSRFVRELPKSPSVGLAKLLGVPTRTVHNRVLKARAGGYLSSGRVNSAGGRARGELTELSKGILKKHFEGRTE